MTWRWTLIRILPRKLLSRGLGYLADCRLPFFILRPLIYWFVTYFKIDMSEYQRGISEFKTFNAFFTRKLKPGLRRIEQSTDHVISPVDGTVGALGIIEKQTLIQAKGISYPLAALLGDEEKAQTYEGGAFITIYLAPYNYHCIHSMLDGEFRATTYIPGELWPVNSMGLAHVDELFARNERVISYLGTPEGECATVKVGAMVVGRIALSYPCGALNLKQSAQQHTTHTPPHLIKAGEEIAKFELGSTVVLLFQPGMLELGALESGQTIQVGETLGTLAKAHS